MKASSGVPKATQAIAQPGSTVACVMGRSLATCPQAQPGSTTPTSSPNRIGASARSARGAQVLVDGLAADADLTGQCCLRGTRAGPLMQFGHLLLAEGPSTAAVCAVLLGQLDPFALPFADQGTFELRERTHHRQPQRRHRGVVTGEGQLFGEEL